MKKYLLFDLDGTLTDSREGIIKSLKYALEDQGIEVEHDEDLEICIGPPLNVIYRDYFDLNPEQIERATLKYRERYNDVGKYENAVYPGIPNLLIQLKSRGFKLGVASSKPEVFVKDILEHFHLDSLFDVIVGSGLDGSRGTKAEVVEEALRQLFRHSEIRKDMVYMIGDRKFDVEGARAMGIESLAVSYGFGDVEELMEAHADYIVQSVPELLDFLLRDDSDVRKMPTVNQRLWTMMANILIFYGTKILGTFLAGTLLLRIAGFPGMGFFLEWNEAENLMEFTKNGNLITTGLGFVVAILFIRKTAKLAIRKTKKDHYLTHLWKLPVLQYVVLFAGTLVLALGVQGILGVTGLTEAASYKQVAEAQFGGTLVISILVNGVAAAVAEELLFRGILFGYGRKYLGILQSMLLSTVLFSALHFNVVQGLYAFIMGFVFVFAYEYFGSILWPILLHIACNVTAVVLTEYDLYRTIIYTWWGAVAATVLGLAAVIWLFTRKKRIFTL